MLNKIRKTIIGLLVGCMLVPNISYAGKPSLEEDRVVELYKAYKKANYETQMFKVLETGEVSKKEEAMVRKYFKYKSIKNMASECAKKDQVELEFQKGYVLSSSAIGPYAADSKMNIEEIFPNIDEMDVEQSYIIRFMFAYKYNRQLKVKNFVDYCDDCNKEFITDKYITMCTPKFLDGSNSCGCLYDIPKAELSCAGAKAVIMRQYNLESNLIKAEEKDGKIILTRFSELGNVVARKYILDKDSRIIEKIIKY